MPEEALDGDTEGRNRDEKDTEESEEQSVIVRKKSDDGEVNTTNDNLKDLRVKCELVDFEGVMEEDEEDDDDDDDDYSEGEDSWFAKVQKQRIEEEKDYVWIRAIDKETYLKIMTPMYLLLEVRSASPLQVQHIRLAVSHLSRVWPWWGVSIRHRGQERIPWLCVAPTQRPTLQVSGAEPDEDEDELWDLVDQQQWRHTKVAEGMLSSVTLIAHPRLSAAAAAVAAAPHAHRNEDIVPDTSGGNAAGGNTSGGNTGGGSAAGGNTSGGNTSDGNAVGGNAAGGNTACSNTSGGNAAGGNATGSNGGVSVPTTSTSAQYNPHQVNDLPELPHRAYLMLGIPCPFVDDVTAEMICRTLVTLLDDVLTGRIQEEYHPPQDSGKDTAEADDPCLESWMAERLETVVEEKAEESESNADPDSGCPQGEENEHDTRGYVQRTFDSITSRNFINRCKAERVSYVNGFTTCVSTAAASFLMTTATEEQEEQRQRVVTRQRVCEHLHWPAPPLDWHDEDHEEDLPSEPYSRPPGVTITAPTGHDDSVFWETARCVSQQRWGTPAGAKKGTAMHILHGLVGEDTDDDMPLQRYPMVSLRLCDIQKDESSVPSVQRAGDVAGLGPHSLSPLRHFLITHTVNLHLEEGTQILSFSLHHSTLFLSPRTGRKFADEIETALKNSLRRR